MPIRFNHLIKHVIQSLFLFDVRIHIGSIPYLFPKVRLKTLI